MKKLDEEYKKELKEAKEAKREAIKYELYNYEAFYTGELDEVEAIFRGIYSKGEILDVYNEERQKISY